MGLRGFVILVPALLLAACAGPVETRVSSTGPGIASPTTILLDAAPLAAAAEPARKAILAKLADRGFAFEDGGELQLQVALSERDAAIAVSAANKIEIAAAKKAKPLQSCADKEFRLSVVLTRISDGALLYRGIAAEYHCKALLADVIPILAERALADLAQPKGDHVVNRGGLD